MCEDRMKGLPPSKAGAGCDRNVCIVLDGIQPSQMERYQRHITFRVNDIPGGMDLDLTRVIPGLKIPQPKDLALDFAFSVGSVLELRTRQWKSLNLPVSRSVPGFVVDQLYDPALFYGAWKAGRLHSGFGALAAERMILHLWAGIPEILVKYRFYVGFANSRGDIDLVSGEGRELRPTIADPYQRLFCLQDPEVMRQVRTRYGFVVKLRREGEEYLVADRNLSVAQTLGFRPCLTRVFGGKDHEARRFLDRVYKDVRIQETHTGRLADSAVFEVDALVAGLMRVTNLLFSEDLGLSFRRTERGPFAIPFLHLAGSRPLTKDKSLSHTQRAALTLVGADKWYATTAKAK